jgi:hypothetical protein
MNKKVAFISILFLWVQLLFSQTTYYSKSAGNLNVVGTWGTNADGTGAAPANFTTAGCTYIIVNNASPTIAANWTISGAGSVLQVGDGTQTISFSVPSPRALVATVNVMSNSTLTSISGSTISSCTISVANNAFLVIQSAANPALGTLATGSTVTYSRAAAQTIVNATYHNLALGGTGNKTLANVSNTYVTNVLTIGSGLSLVLNANNTIALILNGTLTGAGTIAGGANSNLTIGGSGTLGTIIPAASPLTLNTLIVNRSGPGTITLGGNVTVSTTGTITNGIIDLNGHTLILNGALTLPASSANGTITGSSTSNLSIGATAITNNILNFTSGSQALNNFTLNSTGQILKFGNDLTVAGTFIHTAGILDLNGTSLSISGPTTFAISTKGTISGSATSSLLLSSSTITDSLFMTAGAQTLNNFTLNSAVAAVRTLNLGTSITVNGTFTQTKGIIKLNGHILTLNGPAVFPTASTQGTITGTVASDLIINATAVSNSLFFTAGGQTLRNFTLNCPGQTVALGSALTVSGTYSQTNGILNINGKTFTLSGIIIFPASSTNGTISGSSTSNLLITGTSITNNLYMTSGSQTLNNFTFNSTGQTLNLGSDVSASGTFTHTNGILNLNGNSLSLSGPTTFAISTKGTISGSSTSSLLLSSTTITDSLFMTAGAQTLNNFTLNSAIAAVRTLNLGTSLAINGSFTHTKGIIKLNGHVLTLSGPVVFSTASAQGTITGSNTSDLIINATASSNSLFFTAGGQSLRNFTVNCSGQTVKLGSALTVATGFTHTSGILDLNGQTLTLNGTVIFPSSAANGSFSGSAASSLSFGGAGAYTNSMYMTQSGTANYLNNFTLNRAAQTLTLGNTLNLYGTLTPTAGTFASAGNLVLIATSYSVTGRIATIGATGSVTGNVTVQSYAKSGNTGWTTMGSAGISGRTFADWNDNFAITCLNCPDGYMSNFGSVQWYDETVGGTYSNTSRYKEITNITDALTIGKGFWVYLGNGTTTTTDVVMDVTGPVNQGNFAFNLTETNSGGGTQATDHGYNLIANPYPSPIQWSLLRAGGGNPNVANAIYVYNPDLSGYASYVGGVSSPAVGSGGIGNFIPAGQAFYVKANAAAITMTAKETNKGASSQALLKMSNNQQVTSTSTPMVLRLQASGLSMQFETALYFDPGATTAYEDEYDAAYIGVDFGHLGIATSLVGKDYAINGLPPLITNFSIPVKVTTGTTGTYQIAATDFQNLPGGTCIFLHDNYTGLNQDLKSGPYSCTVSDTETVARFVLNLNINNNLSVTSSINNPSCSSTPNGSIIANVSGSAGPWNYYWKDANNNIIKTSLNLLTSDTLSNIAGGNYAVDVTTAGTCDNGTQSFTLQGISSAASSFNPSSNSVILLQDTVSVLFTNTSSNANTYWWDFGDGNGSSDTNTVSYYASQGDYTVTLTAYNALCGDSSVSTQVITVLDSASITGIVTQAAAAADKKMFIAKDAGGYFVQFNYNTKTNAVISVENVLGEKVVSDLHEKNVLDGKVYIPLGNTENKILILSVVTEAGEKTFCKVLNY